MIYLALGDSISIDDYTGKQGGGAASQFARKLGASGFRNLTRDGNTTTAVIAGLEGFFDQPDVVTLTAGGNDLLQLSLRARTANDDMPSLFQAADEIIKNIGQITDRLSDFACPVIMNTIYDPTDGDDALTEQLDIPASWRAIYDRINNGIRGIAQERGFLLCDLEALFHGHGIASQESWFVMEIEPNLLGATAIAAEWHRLYDNSLAHTAGH